MMPFIDITILLAGKLYFFDLKALYCETYFVLISSNLLILLSISSYENCNVDHFIALLYVLLVYHKNLYVR